MLCLGNIAIALLLLQSAESLFTNQPVSALKKKVEATRSRRLGKRDDYDPSLLYPAYNISVPIDHFHNETKYAPHSNGTFDLRYYFDATYYKPGGPVIMLAGGETGVDDRLPFLQKGIVYQLAKATNGLGVLLEHRYYGTSIPTSDLTTESLRFLTTEQALADTAYFAQHVEFEGLNCSLKSPDTPWIVYGGSYAGAFVAFLRVLYPNVFWGAISSSGVTEAIYDYWAYFYRVIQYGPQECIHTTQDFVGTFDKILLGGNSSAITKLETAFGLQNLTHVQDFANTLTYSIGGWQGRNWDPALSDTSFAEYCGNVTTNATIYGNGNLTSAVKDIYSAAGESHPSSSKVTKLLNFIGYMRTNVVDGCTDSQDECFSLLDADFYKQDDLEQWSWRSWAYQYCDQWGYLQTGSGTPEDIKPIVSRTIDIPYTSFICRAAFGINRTSHVEEINKYGGFGISYERLAIIDGQADPWREATPHARVAPARNSTVSEPFLLIEGAVHHWDENGLFPNETTATLPPKPIKKVQREEHLFVKEWVSEWKLKKLLRG